MSQGTVIKILATADVHSPEYLQLYVNLLKGLQEEPDLIVWAGDMVKKNNVHALRPVIEHTRKRLSRTTIVAIFGNEEYRGYEDKYMKMYNDIIWLNDNYTIMKVKGVSLGIIGTRGALDKPTTWQKKNMPWIENYYKELPNKIMGLAKEIRSKCDILVLVSHYGVSYKNLMGENRIIWPHLASKSMEKIIRPDLFDLIIHAHAHKATIEKIVINNVPVYNVSLPAFKKLFMIEVKPVRKGLLAWF